MTVPSAIHAPINQTPEKMGKELLAELRKSQEECDVTKVLSLIAAKANYEERSINNETPIIYAALQGHTECMKALIAAGAKVNEYNYSGFTALMYAAGFGWTDCVKILIEAGANIAQQDFSDKNAMDWLLLSNDKGQHEEIKRILNKAVETARIKFLQDTDCSKGLAVPMKAPKTLQIRHTP